MLKRNFFYLLLLLPSLSSAQIKIKFDNYVSNFNVPVDIAHCGDSRLFIVEKAGYIWILDSLGVRQPESYLDIDARVKSTGNEQGLLGLAFHPNYAQNGWFYLNYIRNTNPGDTRISRFSRDSLNPNKADPNSEVILMDIVQPYTNHNGGCIKFGPDGYLYIGVGDGGSGGDPQNYGQKKNTWLGKMLRIDVNASSPNLNYAIPADNPFVADPAYFPEIWSLGLRNPWRFSFDRLTGDMWIGDVGQNAREEIDFEPINTPGRNYGWRCYEGNQTYNNNNCLPASNFTQPVYTYVNPSIGCSITGGFIYRGSKYPDLYGYYIFADYCSGRIWGTKQDANGVFNTVELANLADSEFSTFGEDRDGELYVALIGSGKIQKVTELCSPFNVTAALSPVACAGASTGSINLTASGTTGAVTYAWSNGATTANINNLSPGQYTYVATNSIGCARRDTLTIEQLSANAPGLTTNDTILCAGQNFSLTATDLPPASTLKWYRDGILIATYTVTGATFTLNGLTEMGSYQVFLSDSTCELASNIITIDQEIAIEPTANLDTYTLYTTEGYWVSYQWLLNNQPIAGATDTFYVATQSGVYELETTSANGCTYQSSGISVVISDTHLPVAVNDFKLTPNPTTDNIRILMSLNKKMTINVTLSDMSQKRVFDLKSNNSNADIPINMSKLAAGTYMLHIRLENGESFFRKIVKL